MKNILFVHSSSELYGSDKSLLYVLKNLDKTKYKLFVLLPCQGPLVEKIKKISDVEIIIYDIAVLRRKNLSVKGGVSYIKKYINSVKYIKSIIKEKKIDLIDTNTAVVFPGAIAAKKSGVKNVWHIREIIKNPFENFIISLVMNHYADVIIANSKSTGNALKVKKSKVRIVYNAVIESNDCRVHESNGLNVGMAGRINRWKGQKLFIDAAKMVIKRIPNANFFIAGDAYIGEEYLKSDLERYIIDNKIEHNVKMLGQVDDMDNFYNNLDVFVLPSIQPEPFGLVVIEAMEHGIPVVATNHGGPTEIIDDKENGFLVDYTCCDEMADCICELLLNDEMRTVIGNKGKIKKRSLFSINRMIFNIDEIYSDLLS